MIGHGVAGPLQGGLCMAPFLCQCWAATAVDCANQSKEHYEGTKLFVKVVVGIHNLVAKPRNTDLAD